MLIIFLIPLNTNDVFSDSIHTLNNEVNTDTAAQEENDSQGEIIVVTMEILACFTVTQCCGSGSGIRDWVLFDPWIRDPE